MKMIQELLPPAVLNLYRNKIRKKYGWFGDYKTWQDASASAGGYDQEEIATKCLESALAVKEGRALYERDSVLFHKPAVVAELLAALYHASAKAQIRVVDFGGAFGSLFFQHRKYIEEMKISSWTVVEQPKFVELGRKHLEAGLLRFDADLNKNLSDGRTFVIFSSVLQYLENPHELLTNTVLNKPEYVFVDRTGFMHNGRERITVQKVHPAIYSATYACRFFSESKFKFVMQNYDLKFSWDSFDVANIDASFRGFFFEKI